MRLEDINDYEQANKFLSKYLLFHNNKFSVQPANSDDFHESLRPENDLELIFTTRKTRKLLKNPEFQYDRVVYQIHSDRPLYALKGRKVDVCENEKGIVAILLNGMPLQFKRFYKQPKQHPVSSSKEIDQASYKPARDHPWRNYGQQINGKPIQMSD